jgi:hypothetical protein
MFGGCKKSRRVRAWMPLCRTARRAAPVRYLAPRIHSHGAGRLPSSRAPAPSGSASTQNPACPARPRGRSTIRLAIHLCLWVQLLLGDIPRASAAHSHAFPWVAFASPRSRCTTRAYRPQQRPPEPMARQRLCSEHPDVESRSDMGPCQGLPASARACCRSCQFIIDVGPVSTRNVRLPGPLNGSPECGRGSLATHISISPSSPE